jgi:hypothetical protein
MSYTKHPFMTERPRKSPEEEKAELDALRVKALAISGQQENGLEYLREEHRKAVEKIELLQRRVDLDMAKMLSMAEGLRRAEKFLLGMKPPRPYGVIQAVQKAQRSAPALLFSGPAELSKGMICGYLGEEDRIDAPDQIVSIHVTGMREENGE